MSRKKADPVDATFDLWRNLDTDQQKRFEDQKRGYQQAMGVVAAPAPRVRQRKAKVNGSLSKLFDIDMADGSVNR